MKGLGLKFFVSPFSGLDPMIDYEVRHLLVGGCRYILNCREAHRHIPPCFEILEFRTRQNEPLQTLHAKAPHLMIRTHETQIATKPSTQLASYDKTDKIGALIIRIGFWGPLYSNYNKEPV